MECALCKNPILASVHGFCQLPCNHTFHPRCMVPSCSGFWSNEPIGCKICGPKEEEGEQENDVVIPTNEQAVQLMRQNEMTVNDAYRIISDIEEKRYEDNVTAHVKTLTKKQKEYFKMYVTTCRVGKKQRAAIRGQMIRRRREFIKDNIHIISAFNKVYRKFVRDFLNMDIYKSYKKTFKKNQFLYNYLVLTATNNQHYRVDDICMELKYSRIPIYLNFDLHRPRTMRYNFHTISDMLFNVKNLDKQLYIY